MRSRVRMVAAVLVAACVAGCGGRVAPAGGGDADGSGGGDATVSELGGFEVVSVAPAPGGDTFVLGTADCDGAPCTSVARSGDGGRTWRGVAAPAAYVPGPGLLNSRLPVPEDVRHLRFGTARDGWAYGGALWSTHDGAGRWTEVDLGGEEVLDVASTGVTTYAVVADCGDANGADCADPRLLASPADRDAFVQVAALAEGPVERARLSAADGVVVAVVDAEVLVRAVEPAPGTGPAPDPDTTPGPDPGGGESGGDAGDGWGRSRPCPGGGVLGAAAASAAPTAGAVPSAGAAPGGSAPGGSAPGGSAPGGSAPGRSVPGGSPARGGSAVVVCADAALGSRYLTVRRSADGRTWTPVRAASPPRVTDGLLSVAATGPGVVAVAWAGSGGGGLLTSADGGRSWTDVRPAGAGWTDVQPVGRTGLVAVPLAPTPAYWHRPAPTAPWTSVRVG